MSISRIRFLTTLARVASVSIVALLTGASVFAQTPVLKARAERQTAVYSVGERVVFQIKLEKDGAPADGVDVDWTLTLDGGRQIKSGTARIAGGVAEVDGSLDEPGFLQCKVTLPGGEKPLTALAAAAIDPQNIKPSAPAPDDFDAFWNERKKALAAVPLNIRLTPVKSTDESIEVFELQADCLGAPVSGYYARPVGAAPKSLPAFLSLHGAGVQSASISGIVGWAKLGMIALDINAHGLPNGKPKTFYTDLAKGELKDYRSRGRDSRDTIYFQGMFLRVKRALDALTAQPEWDGKTLITRGTSQGAGQSLAGAYLDPRVTFYIAGVTALADHTGAEVGRSAGWPKFIPTGGSDELKSKVREAARYYDVVNFASRIRAEGFFTVGFIDTTTPPTGVYAAYNAAAGRKKMFHDIEVGHTNTPEASRAMRDAVIRHIRQQARR